MNYDSIALEAEAVWDEWRTLAERQKETTGRHMLASVIGALKGSSGSETIGRDTLLRMLQTSAAAYDNAN
jgi:hypothetical protein